MHVFPKSRRKTCSDPQPFLPVDLPLLLFGLPPSYQRNKHCGTNSVLVLIIWRAEKGFDLESRRRSQVVMRNLQKCASFFCIEWYPSKSPIELTRASPLPPTSQAKPILFGKYKCQVKLWWTSSSDVHPRFHPTLPIFRHQPFGSNKPVGRRTWVYHHLPQVNACQNSI